MGIPGTTEIEVTHYGTLPHDTVRWRWDGIPDLANRDFSPHTLPYWDLLQVFPAAKLFATVPWKVEPVTIAKTRTSLPQTSAERKQIPLCTGVLDYFTSALVEVARVSFIGNEKHNPGEPLHWARGKSMDHADCILRHLAERGGTDPETGLRHSAALAWRALALLQQEMEDEGAPVSKGSK